MRALSRWLLVVLVIVAGALATTPSHAFCGFFVKTVDSPAAEPLYNDASRVVLMRAGLRTVLSIQNDYVGPLQSFALVVPVPVVLAKENVRTLPREAFDRIDVLSGPRLVEYWERDPCAYVHQPDSSNKEGGTGSRSKGDEGSMGNPTRKPLVKVEAEFAVDEYDVVVLSAQDSGALETWLRDNHYAIPPGAEPFLRPYVQDGSKFFVAKVDAQRVHFRWGRASLSPLRFFYDTPSFSLPTRLGLINSSGTQDLLIHILGADRYETANYENLTIPTNLNVKVEVRNRFNTFYASLFDQTVASHPRAAVTEYATRASDCPSCPSGSGPLSREDVSLFGGDVIKPLPENLVLTRIHARYGKDANGDDFVFRVARPIENGPKAARPAATNGFQARYAVHHAWTDPADCASPQYGIWDNQPEGPPPPPLPRSSSLTPRGLNVADLVLDGEEERRVLAGGTHRGSLPWLTWLWRRPDTEGHIQIFLVGIGLAVIAVAIAARRRKRGVLKTMGLLAFFLACLYAVLVTLTDGSDLRRAARTAVNEPLIVLAAIASMIALSMLRVPARERLWRGMVVRLLWALLPVFVAIEEGPRQRAHVYSILEDGDPVDIQQASRITGELLSELLRSAALGYFVSGILLVAVGWFVERGTDDPARRPRIFNIGTVVALALAGLTRFALHGAPGHFEASDSLALVVFMAAAALVGRAGARRGEPEAIAAIFGVIVGFALVDIAARLEWTALGLGATSRESLDTAGVTRILADTIDGERRRLVFLICDTIVLTALATIRLRGATPRAAIGQWLRSPRGMAMGLAGVLVVTSALTAPFWLGRSSSFAVIDPTAVLARRDGSPAPTRASFVDDALSGPILIVERAPSGATALLATPGNGEAPVPYGPRVIDKMGRASGTQPNGPVVVAPTTLSFGEMLDALAPLLAGHQTDYRLVFDLARSDADLGVYAPLVAARNAVATRTFDLTAKLLTVGPDQASTEKTRLATGFVFTGRSLQLVPLAQGRDGLSKADFKLPNEVLLRGDDDELFAQVVANNANSAAVVAFPRDTTVEAMRRGLDVVMDLKTRDWPRLPVFTKIYVTPDIETLNRLR